MTQVERDAIEILLIGLDVFLLQSLIAYGHSIMQALPGLSSLVTGYVLIAFDIGADGQVDDGLVGPHHTETAIAAGHLASLGSYRHASLKANLALQALVLGRDT